MGRHAHLKREHILARTCWKPTTNFPHLMKANHAQHVGKSCHITSYYYSPPLPDGLILLLRTLKGEAFCVKTTRLLYRELGEILQKRILVEISYGEHPLVNKGSLNLLLYYKGSLALLKYGVSEWYPLYLFNAVTLSFCL